MADVAIQSDLLRISPPRAPHRELFAGGHYRDRDIVLTLKGRVQLCLPHLLYHCGKRSRYSNTVSTPDADKGTKLLESQTGHLLYNYRYCLNNSSCRHDCPFNSSATAVGVKSYSTPASAHNERAQHTHTLPRADT